jgi:prepilin-type N-terminal cleavage/methylation domain-containing protein
VPVQHSPVRTPHPRRAARARHGHTLPELVVVLVVLLLATTIAAARWRALADRAGVRMAAADLASLLAEARDVALAGAQVVSARVDSADGSVTLRGGADTVARRALGALHGVRVAASRESVTYSPLGLGRGLANARYVLARGAAAETVWVSRLGRVRVGGGE